MQVPLGARAGEGEPARKWYHEIMDSPTFRGGVLGAVITAFVSWNSSTHGRIGKLLSHWKFVRHFVSAKPLATYCHITNYHHACLDIAANNFYCYSGESGIGKSLHFQQLISQESQVRPSLYVSFKAVGRPDNFENDLAEQLNYGSTASMRGGIVGEIVRAIKQIQRINQFSGQFRRRYYLTNLSAFVSYAVMLAIPDLLELQIALLGPIFLAQVEFIRFMQPLILQSRRRTIPVIVFDDLNKLEHLGMLAEITRFFKILEAKSANLMMVSSNEETWAKLRLEPGMKDRLRVRQLRYNHDETARMLVELIEDSPDSIPQYFTSHPLFSLELIKELAKFFIGVKQMSIRRFTSVLKLVDEEEYERLVEILKNTSNLPASELVLSLRDVIFETEVHTLTAHFRSIKRELPRMSQGTFIATLRVVVQQHKLPSDSRVGALLKAYNIMRDLRSEYVINGGYMLKLFEMAIEEYRSQVKLFQLPDYKDSDFSSQY